MRVLVYGAGVIGCEMAHRLCMAKQDVTLLARGQWRASIAQNGLTIRHYAQLHTTVDRVTTLEALAHDDVYDLLFVTMQQGQVAQVLGAIERNQSRHVVLVGNNLQAQAAARALAASQSPKQVAFGFQATGGRRERGRVISVHAGVGMTIGCLNAPLDEVFRQLLKQAFHGSGYRLTEEDHMDAWLKCHAAFILPIAYLCYATDFHLPAVTGRQVDLAMDATLEAYAVLQALGYPLRPAGCKEDLVQSRKRTGRLLWIMAKTPLGRLAASDHCKAAGGEMMLLDADFEALRQKAALAMPAWEALRAAGKPHASCDRAFR